jgi:hypothetical protein
VNSETNLPNQEVPVGAPTDSLPSVIDTPFELFPETDDPYIITCQDVPTIAHPQAAIEPAADLEPDSEPTVIEEPSPQRSTLRIPKHLCDFILLTNLSKQTHFAPSRKLPRVRCEILNHQRLSSLKWDNLLTSLRGGAYGSLLNVYTTTFG